MPRSAQSTIAAQKRRAPLRDITNTSEPAAKRPCSDCATARNSRRVRQPTLAEVFRPCGASGCCSTSTESNGSASVHSTTSAAPDPPLPSLQSKVLYDIDAPFRLQPKHCSEYAEDIHQYFRDVEQRLCPTFNFMETVQSDITPRMLSLLLDWLVEVALEFHLSRQTLYLCKNYVTRFLSQQAVSRKQLQLVGMAAILLASKYEEIYAPEVSELVYISENAYTKEEVLAMESIMVQVLGFELAAVTEANFLRRFQKAASADLRDSRTDLERFIMLSDYLTELTILEYGFLNYPVSMIAACAVYLALITLGRKWTPTLHHYSLYNPVEEKFQSCLKLLHGLHVNFFNKKYPQLRAIADKYSTTHYRQVSAINPCARLA